MYDCLRSDIGDQKSRKVGLNMRYWNQVVGYLHAADPGRSWEGTAVDDVANLDRRISGKNGAVVAVGEYGGRGLHVFVSTFSSCLVIETGISHYQYRD